MPVQVLVIASELIASRIVRTAQAGGMELTCAPSLDSGLAVCGELEPDAVVLEAAMGGIRANAPCSRLREISDVPLVVLIASASAEYVAKLLEAGADDCVSISASSRELVARVRALIRRHNEYSSLGRQGCMLVGGLRIDVDRHEVVFGEVDIPLTPREFDLLAALGRRPGVVSSREELLAGVWSGNVSQGSRTLDVHIGRLRRKLDRVTGGRVRIATVPGVGYRVECEDAAEARPRSAA